MLEDDYHIQERRICVVWCHKDEIRQVTIGHTLK